MLIQSINIVLYGIVRAAFISNTIGLYCINISEAINIFYVRPVNVQEPLSIYSVTFLLLIDSQYLQYEPICEKTNIVDSA